MNKPAVCIATIRPDSFIEWADAWRDEFKEHNVQVFAMVDAEKVGRRFSKAPITGQFFCHEMVKDQLKDKAWIIPSKTSACKSFAIYKAWQAGCDPIMVLDDDCLPDKDSDWTWLRNHSHNLQLDVRNDLWPTIRGLFARGTPHNGLKPVVLSHGTWVENIDIDAVTSLMYPKHEDLTKSNDNHVPMGCLFPMSGMNLAFRREIAPLMYFGLQGPDWGVDRFDDIWCGFLAKKVLDYCGYAVWSGTPYVRHIKASDPFVNIVKEAPGYKMNVELYQWAMMHTTTGEGLKETFETLAHSLETWGRLYGNNGYWKEYAKAIQTWLTLFEPEEAFGI